VDSARALLRAADRCLRVAQDVGGVALLIAPSTIGAAAGNESYGALRLDDAPLSLVLPLAVVADALKRGFRTTSGWREGHAQSSLRAKRRNPDLGLRQSLSLDCVAVARNDDGCDSTSMQHALVGRVRGPHCRNAPTSASTARGAPPGRERRRPAWKPLVSEVLPPSMVFDRRRRRAKRAPLTAAKLRKVMLREVDGLGRGGGCGEAGAVEKVRRRSRRGIVQQPICLRNAVLVMPWAMRMTCTALPMTSSGGGALL